MSYVAAGGGSRLRAYPVAAVRRALDELEVVADRDHRPAVAVEHDDRARGLIQRSSQAGHGPSCSAPQGVAGAAILVDLASGAPRRANHLQTNGTKQHGHAGSSRTGEWLNKAVSRTPRHEPYAFRKTSSSRNTARGNARTRRRSGAPGAPGGSAGGEVERRTPLAVTGGVVSERHAIIHFAGRSGRSESFPIGAITAPSSAADPVSRARHPSQSSMTPAPRRADAGRRSRSTPGKAARGVRR